MERILKFRVWDEITRCLYPFTFQDVGAGGFIFIKGLSVVPLLPFNITQSTDLLDRDGKEIYKGDILSYISTEYEDKETGRTSCVGEVVWYDNFCFAFRYKDKNDVWFLNSDFDFKKVKVIGNIFENPESLKIQNL